MKNLKNLSSNLNQYQNNHHYLLQRRLMNSRPQQIQRVKTLNSRSQSFNSLSLFQTVFLEPQMIYLRVEICLQAPLCSLQRSPKKRLKLQKSQVSLVSVQRNLRRTNKMRRKLKKNQLNSHYLGIRISKQQQMCLGKEQLEELRCLLEQPLQLCQNRSQLSKFLFSVKSQLKTNRHLS